MNRKELDLIAKALNKAKPHANAHEESDIRWGLTVDYITEALIEKGHLVSQDNINRFESIAQNGIIRGSV